MTNKGEKSILVVITRGSYASTFCYVPEKYKSILAEMNELKEGRCVDIFPIYPDDTAEWNCRHYKVASISVIGDCTKLYPFNDERLSSRLVELIKSYQGYKNDLECDGFTGSFVQYMKLDHITAD